MPDAKLLREDAVGEVHRTPVREARNDQTNEARQRRLRIERRCEHTTGLGDEDEVAVLLVAFGVAMAGVRRHRLGDANVQALGELVELVDRDRHVRLLGFHQDAVAKDPVLTDERIEIEAELPALLAVAPGRDAHVRDVLRLPHGFLALELAHHVVEEGRDVIDDARPRRAGRRHCLALHFGHEAAHDGIALVGEELGEGHGE